MPATHQLFRSVESYFAASSTSPKSHLDPRKYRPSQVHFRPKTQSGHIQVSDRSDSIKDERVGGNDLESGSSRSSTTKCLDPSCAVHAYSARGRGWSVDASGILQIADQVQVVSTRVNPLRGSNWLGASTYSCKIEGGAAVPKLQASA